MFGEGVYIRQGGVDRAKAVEQRNNPADNHFRLLLAVGVIAAVGGGGGVDPAVEMVREILGIPKKHLLISQEKPRHLPFIQ